jgi:hypothetical protein
VARLESERLRPVPARHTGAEALLDEVIDVLAGLLHVRGYRAGEER